MGKGLVLVIEADEWVARLLASAIREAGYEVVHCATAKDGLLAVTTREPDCIVCSVTLPDNDGFWVAQNVRTQPSRVAVVPFLFLSGLDDQESRLQGFHVGADVYITKPFRVEDVVAQVKALVLMAARLRERRGSFISIPPEEISAITGDLSQMSIATVLTVLEMERRSGTFDVVSKKRRARLELASGFVLGGTVGGTKVSALAALRTMLAWTVGRFSFVPSAPKAPPKEETPLSSFLLEAVRLQDESARLTLELELDLPPASVRRSTDHRLAAPALGGPPSSVEDFAPPSSRTPITLGSPLTKPSTVHRTAGERGEQSPGFATSAGKLGPARITTRPIDSTVPIELDSIHLESDTPPPPRLPPPLRGRPVPAPPPLPMSHKPPHLPHSPSSPGPAQAAPPPRPGGPPSIKK